VHIAGLGAAGAEAFAAGFFGRLDQPAIRSEVLHRGEAVDVVDLVENPGDD